MAIKSSNVVARAESEIKEKPEAILSSLGITASSGINRHFLRAQQLQYKTVMQGLCGAA